MSQLLAIECATDIGSVAVGSPGEVRAEILIPPRRHAAQLVPAIETVLTIGGVTFADLRGIIVSDGPGSFTGLRIGAATALGIVRAQPAITLQSVVSLVGAAAVGQRMGFETVAALYDALRGEVFAVVCRAEGGRLQLVDGPRLTTPERLAAGECRPDVTLGDGAWRFRDLMEAWSGREPLAPEVAGPRASALIELAAFPEYLTLIDEPGAVTPDYGRQADAQVKWEHRHGRPLPDSTSQPR